MLLLPDAGCVDPFKVSLPLLEVWRRWWLKATNARKSASKQYPAEKDMSHPDRLSRNYGPTRQASPITMATPTNEEGERERQSKSSPNCTSSWAVNADTLQSFVSVESVETCFSHSCAPYQLCISQLNCLQIIYLITQQFSPTNQTVHPSAQRQGHFLTCKRNVSLYTHTRTACLHNKVLTCIS